MTVGQPDPDTAKAIFGGPSAVTREDFIAQWPRDRCGDTRAELILIDGMGHDLPPGLRQRIADAIARVMERREARVASEA